jgi:hypothetical protein
VPGVCLYEVLVQVDCACASDKDNNRGVVMMVREHPRGAGC